jgi:hypothetical protein
MYSQLFSTSPTQRPLLVGRRVEFKVKKEEEKRCSLFLLMWYCPFEQNSDLR